MKAKNLLFIIGILLVLLNDNIVAQSDRIEKTINGDTYVIDKNTSIKNKKNKKFRGNACEYFYVKDDSSLEHAFKKTFSKDRLNQLAQMEATIRLTVYCDASGKIEEVSFYVRKSIDAFPLGEIQLLEKNIKGLTIKIKSDCPDVNEYRISKMCKFKDRFWDK